MELMVEASPRRTFANAHTYHINSISVNSDQQTYMSADDLRVNLWHLEITDQSFSILYILWAAPGVMWCMSYMYAMLQLYTTFCVLNLFIIICRVNVFAAYSDLIKVSLELCLNA